MSDGYVCKISGTSFSSPIIVGLIAKYYDEIVQTPEFSQIKNFLSSIDLFLNKKGLYNEKDKIKEIFKPKLKALEKENSCYLNKENIISFLTELTYKEKKLHRSFFTFDRLYDPYGLQIVNLFQFLFLFYFRLR